MNLFRLKNSNSTNPNSNGRALLLVGLVLACFGLSPTAQAVVPAPDGFYPAGNTAEGEDALFNLTFGNKNTAIGFNALYTNTIGGFNTAIGSQALFNNLAGFDNTAIGSFALYNNKKVLATQRKAAENRLIMKSKQKQFPISKERLPYLSR